MTPTMSPIEEFFAFQRSYTFFTFHQPFKSPNIIQKTHHENMFFVYFAIVIDLLKAGDYPSLMGGWVVGSWRLFVGC